MDESVGKGDFTLILCWLRHSSLVLVPAACTVSCITQTEDLSLIASASLLWWIAGWWGGLGSMRRKHQEDNSMILKQSTDQGDGRPAAVSMRHRHSNGKIGSGDEKTMLSRHRYELWMDWRAVKFVIIRFHSYIEFQFMRLTWDFSKIAVLFDAAKFETESTTIFVTMHVLVSRPFR